MEASSLMPSEIVEKMNMIHQKMDFDLISREEEAYLSELQNLWEENHEDYFDFAPFH